MFAYIFQRFRLKPFSHVRILVLVHFLTTGKPKVEGSRVPVTPMNLVGEARVRFSSSQSRGHAGKDVLLIVEKIYRDENVLRFIYICVAILFTSSASLVHARCFGKFLWSIEKTRKLLTPALIATSCLLRYKYCLLKQRQSIHLWHSSFHAIPGHNLALARPVQFVVRSDDRRIARDTMRSFKRSPRITPLFVHIRFVAANLCRSTTRADSFNSRIPARVFEERMSRREVSELSERLVSAILLSNTLKQENSIALFIVSLSLSLLFLLFLYKLRNIAIARARLRAI